MWKILSCNDFPHYSFPKVPPLLLPYSTETVTFKNSSSEPILSSICIQICNNNNNQNEKAKEKENFTTLLAFI